MNALQRGWIACAMRDELATRPPHKGRTLPDHKLAALAEHVRTHGGDIAMAVDALFMWPRPEWVEALVGPHPDAELLNPLDVASVDEWGPAG